jgi:hypothetical protein
LEVIATPADVLGFVRREGPDRVLMLFNLGVAPAEVDLPAGDWGPAFDLGGTLDGEVVRLPVATAFAATGRSGPP